MKPLVHAALLFSLAAFSATTAKAAATVNVLLDDSSSDPTATHMRLSLDHSSIAAGRVTIRAQNQSKNLVHEVIVVRVDPKKPELPYDEKKAQVIEKQIHRMGEIADLKPGATRAITLGLKPGAYLLICNQPGHYKAGMVASLTVNK
jgi:uncharacterized cupredoxin-like copper-binding protein